MKPVKEYINALTDRSLMPTAIKVALVVGTILLSINHGSALVQDKMTRERWFSALITYLVPYSVNIHGQYIRCSRQKEKEHGRNHQQLSTIN